MPTAYRHRPSKSTIYTPPQDQDPESAVKGLSRSYLEKLEMLQVGYRLATRLRSSILSYPILFREDQSPKHLSLR
jgi:hypothetical protein